MGIRHEVMVPKSVISILQGIKLLFLPEETNSFSGRRSFPLLRRDAGSMQMNKVSPLIKGVRDMDSFFF